jgi:hypothetical protein
MQIFRPSAIGPAVIVSAVLGLLPMAVLAGKAHAQASTVETKWQSATQSRDERELLADLARSPLMRLKSRLTGISLNREFGKVDTDIEDSRSLPALSFVKIADTRRAPDYGPLWSMVVAVHQNGVPLRTRDGKLIKGWARTDCFVPSDLPEPAFEPPPRISVGPPSAANAPG